MICILKTDGKVDFSSCCHFENNVNIWFFKIGFASIHFGSSGKKCSGYFSFREALIKYIYKFFSYS